MLSLNITKWIAVRLHKHQKHDDIVMDKVCNPDQPTQVGLKHKFVSC